MEPRPRDRQKAETPEQHSGTGRAIVIGPYLRERGSREALTDSEIRRTPDARLDEAVGLALAIDLAVVDSGIVALSQIRPATFIGKGKAEEITELVISSCLPMNVADESGSAVNRATAAPVAIGRVQVRNFA